MFSAFDLEWEQNTPPQRNSNSFMNTVADHIRLSEVDICGKDPVVRIIKVPLWMHSDVVFILYLFDIAIFIFVTYQSSLALAHPNFLEVHQHFLIREERKNNTCIDKV